MENHGDNLITTSPQTSRSLEDTEKIAKDWLAAVSLKYKNSDKALVVGLSGHLGAGKTAFVKAVAKILGINESVTSPTFVLMKFYKVNDDNYKWQNLVHLDLYRLEKKEELKVLDLQKLILNKNNLIMIEWPENVGVEVDEQIDFMVLEEGIIEIREARSREL